MAERDVLTVGFDLDDPGLRTVLEADGKTLEDLTAYLLPVLRGWCRVYRQHISCALLSRVDHRLSFSVGLRTENAHVQELLRTLDDAVAAKWGIVEVGDCHLSTANIRSLSVLNMLQSGFDWGDDDEVERK